MGERAHDAVLGPHTWSYLLVDPARGGSGKLSNGGSYVTLKNFATGDFSIVVEKMSRDHSSCVRPGLPGYATTDEVATFTLGGSLASVTQLQVWYTRMYPKPNPAHRPEPPATTP